ncbi:ribonuclease H-like domain-containing protein [Tanacetum coccineum]
MTFLLNLMLMVFLVKDNHTQKLLLRCDSTGDLYPVTHQPSFQIPVALLSLSSTTWHIRLGHLGEDVPRHLESGNLISCNKSKLSALCHACQLGKHVKLPFYSYEFSVQSVFEIIHSDLWTSPISSESDAIFLDHFFHFVWVYPLQKKSDLFDTFVAFRAYVNKQFNVDIKALQCDHGGEYDNTRFHDLFRQNGIQFQFSCPRTSQHNGKSERMLRTINNLIRTLLFQANIPPSYWVEALNMAAYLLNILPSTAIKNEIPFTKLYNQTPTYEHLCVLDVFAILTWLQIHKFHARGSLNRYKARLVANGRSQQQGIDCDERFSLVVKLATIHTLSYNGLLLCYMSTYVEEIIERAHVQKCNPCRNPVDTESKLGADGDPVSDPTLYRSLAGLLQYLTFTRSDISYAVQHLIAYTDADWVGCPVTRRSTSGYCVFLGDNLLSWFAKRHVTLSRSSDEAQYKGVANVVAETAWVRNLLRELHAHLFTATFVYCDNVSAVYLSTNSFQHQHTKHIEIDIHFVHDYVASGQLRVLHVPSQFQYADILP